jgi:NADPH:quinone reductase-like Zn-dependent oxidoreductase
MATETMKAVRMHDYGGSDVLVHEEVERPEPAPDEVLVRVRAATINPIDWKVREGYLRGWMDLPLPLILGHDMAGDVVAVGSDVTGFQVGDAVFGSMSNFMKGTHAEYVAAPAAEIAKKPATLDYETAASVPQAALAGWQTVLEAGALQEGQTVLVHGAAGNVGRYAVQFAKQRGARVIGTARQINMQMVSDLGADEVIDYEKTHRLRKDPLRGRS